MLVGGRIAHHMLAVGGMVQHVLIVKREQW